MSFQPPLTQCDTDELIEQHVQDERNVEPQTG